eukprot:GHVL01009259.1.p1 GENE.GHVL01009259.1~~GHVL01009259.1.p1  ORF type:complete len:426 (-),score=52.59 GHVL01009259.1:1168-2445(-)
MTSESILTQIHNVYYTKKGLESGVSSANSMGLKQLGQELGVRVHSVQKKSNVLIIGNHSAGKSTFINWYVREPLQKTGVAIETAGFTFVINGNSPSELKGESTLMVIPFLEELCRIHPDFIDHLSAKTFPAAESRLTLVNLIDTPGLADGDLKYPFDIDAITKWLVEHVDLVFVFLDPIGQALCRRTTAILKEVHEQNSSKIRYFMTKTDQIRTEADRIKVICQITGSLTEKISNRYAFDLKPIYIPGAEDDTYLIRALKNLNKTECETTSIGSREIEPVNRIDEAVSDIQKTVNNKVQENLNIMKLDCDAVNAAIDERLKVYEKFNKLAKQAGRTRCCSFSFGWILLVLSIACISVNYYEIHPKIKEGVSMIENFTGRPNSMGQIGYVAGGIALFLFFVAVRSYIYTSVNEVATLRLQLFKGHL